MGKAYVCDHCGELFKKNDYSGTVPVVLESHVPFYLAFVNTCNEYISLCPKCRASFQKWWDQEAVHKTTEARSGVNTLYEVE